MESRVKLLGHPVHPMLVVFPIGLLATAVIFDFLYSIFRKPVLAMVSFYMIVSGVIGGLMAAIFGLIDWLALPLNSRAKQIGGWHGLGNLAIVVLSAVSALLRGRNVNSVPSGPARILSSAVLVMALVTSWIGGELVYRLGVGVDPDANVNAPSSLPETRAGRIAERVVTR
jgi:uncharacterized membrane protein